VLCALLAAIAVAVASYWLGSRWATQELETRIAGIRQTLAGSTFPLNDVVLRSIADMTQTELVTIGNDGKLQRSTAKLSAAELSSFSNNLHKIFDRSAPESKLIESKLVADVANRRYRVYPFDTTNFPIRTDDVQAVVVLFDESLLEASRRRAALLPLATGLSTILALSSLTFILTSRLVRRVATLQRRVEKVAAGDFDSTVSDSVRDEVGQLGNAVDSMARQLKQLWKKVNQQQSEKLLHQIAGGMAHQLRNSLTGARMAVELHASECPNRDDEGVQVAIDQIELSEDYVRRLLLVASGRQDQDRPACVLNCLTDIRSSFSTVARHLRVDIAWNWDDAISDQWVKDGSTWVAAITNLIHNAMQAGDRVEVVASLLNPESIRVSVRDNGTGVAEEVAAEVFEPFVTSKPEGMGLGLTVVRRAAKHLGGSVEWYRRDDQTVFDFDASVTDGQ